MADEPEAIPVDPTALTFSVSAVMGDPAQGDPNIVFQTHLKLADGEAANNASVDMIMRIVARQSAVAEIVRIDRHIRQAEKMIVLAAGEFSDAAYKDQVRVLREQISAKNAQAPGITEADRVAFENAGRAGAYKPSRETSGKIAGLKKEAEGLQSQIFTLDLERSETLKAIEQKTKGWRDEIDEARANIARLSLIVNPPANAQAMAAE